MKLKYKHNTSSRKIIMQDKDKTVRGALQRMLERKMAVEQLVKAKINVQVRI